VRNGDAKIARSKVCRIVNVQRLTTRLTNAPDNTLVPITTTVNSRNRGQWSAACAGSRIAFDTCRINARFVPALIRSLRMQNKKSSAECRHINANIGISQPT